MTVHIAADDGDGSGVQSISCSEGPLGSNPTTSLGSTHSVTLGEGLRQLNCTATDFAGNVSDTLAFPTIMIDETPPTITITRNPPDNGVWNNRTFVTAFATATDDLSGVAGGTGGHIFSTNQRFADFHDGANQFADFSFSDNAGNVAYAHIGDINVDTTPPVVLANDRFPAPNEFGWNKEPVNVRFLALDATSGLTGPSNVELRFTDEVEGLIVEHTYTDVAGNSLTVRSPDPISIDRARPSFIADSVCCLGGFSVDDWFDRDVTVHFFAVDNLSYLQDGLFEEVTAVVSDEGQNVFEHTVTDRADNSATYRRIVKIDKTPPLITTDTFPAANANGWNNTPVTLRWQARDDVSGISGSPITKFLADFNVRDLHATRDFRDLAGNLASASIGGINVDRDPPDVRVSRSPDPNANGWNNTDISVHMQATDSFSGMDDPSTFDQVFTDDGAQFAQHAFFDLAGNRAFGQLVGINIDKVPPVVTNISRFPSANAYGWSNRTVEARFDATDNHGIVGSPVAFVDVTSDGANQTARATFTDVGGNTTTAELGGINVDQTPPTVVATRSPEPNQYGWNNSNVTVHFAASDALSGMLDPTSSDVLVTSEGPNQSVSSSAFTDRAGNRGFGSIGVSLDKTPPSLYCVTDPLRLWPPNRRLVPVTAQVFFDDGDVYSGSSGGPAGIMPLTAVTSSVPLDGSIVGWDVGTADTSGEFLAWRAAAAPVYSLSYEGFDFAGNRGTCTALVPVAR